MITLALLAVLVPGHLPAETALRFKYTSWFGLISRIDGEWRIEWQSYRRPMLPAPLKGQAEQICSLFEGG